MCCLEFVYGRIVHLASDLKALGLLKATDSVRRVRSQRSVFFPEIVPQVPEPRLDSGDLIGGVQATDTEIDLVPTDFQLAISRVDG